MNVSPEVRDELWKSKPREVTSCCSKYVHGKLSNQGKDEFLACFAKLSNRDNADRGKQIIKEAISCSKKHGPNDDELQFPIKFNPSGISDIQFQIPFPENRCRAFYRRYFCCSKKIQWNYVLREIDFKMKLSSLELADFEYIHDELSA